MKKECSGPNQYHDAFNMQNMQKKYEKKYAFYAFYANHSTNMQNMHRPGGFGWCSRRLEFQLVPETEAQLGFHHRNSDSALSQVQSWSRARSEQRVRVTQRHDQKS